MAVARFDALRTVTSGAITGSYTTVGAVLANNTRIVKFTNNTNGDLLLSYDGTTDNDFVPAGGFVLYDFSTNAPNINDSDSLVLAINTQFYVRYSTAPSSGALWITSVYARGV